MPESLPEKAFSLSPFYSDSGILAWIISLTQNFRQIVNPPPGGRDSEYCEVQAPIQFVAA